MVDIDAVDRILIQLADRQWTLEATHLACQVARLRGAEIIFIKMVAVQNIGWLGTELGYRDFSDEDYDNMEDYAATAEDYGVLCSVHRYQYITFPEGMSNVADHYRTQLVFAKPIHKIKIIRQIQFWLLRRALVRHDQQLANGALVESLLLTGRHELAELQHAKQSV